MGLSSSFKCYTLYIGTMRDDAQSYLDQELWPFFLALMKSHLLNLEQTSSNGTIFMNQHISFKLWHYSHHTLLDHLKHHEGLFSTTAYNIVVISCLRVKWFNLFLLAGVLLQYWNYPSNLNAFARQDNLILEALLEECSKLLFCLAASCDVEYGSFYELDPSGAFFVSSVGEQTVLGMLTAKMLTFIAVRLWQTT